MLRRVMALGAVVVVLSALSPVAGHAELASVASAAQPDTGVRDASGDTGNPQTEQTLAVDPTNPNNAVISYINLGMSVTHDGGLTWRFTPLGASACIGDNNPVFDQAGTAYYQCDNQGVSVSRDHGDTWGAPVIAYTTQDNNGDLADRPWMVRGPRVGTLYLGYESFFTTPAPGYVFMKQTMDGGATWPEPATRVDDPAGLVAAMNPRHFPAVGGDGTLYFSYATGSGSTSFVVARSHDGGKTFARVVAAPNITRTTAPTEEGEAISSLAADPDPARSNHLVLTWADMRSGDSRILMVSSVDGGATWSKPVDIADDAAGKGNNHDHPQAAFAPDGRVIVVWRDRRCCGGAFSSNYQLFARALSVTSSGVTASSNSVQVTDRAEAPNQVQNVDEYLGLVVGVEGVSVAWNQPLNGIASSYFRRIPLSAFPESASTQPVVVITPGGRAGMPNSAGVTQGASAAALALAVCVMLVVGTGRRRDRGRRRAISLLPVPHNGSSPSGGR